MMATKARTAMLKANARSRRAKRTVDVVNAVAAAATDGILGPNPFIGLRASDVLATLGRIGSRIVMQPALAVDHEAALVRDLVAIVAGKANVAPAAGDRRFADPTWSANALYRRCMQAYLACGNALDSFIVRSSLDVTSKERARFLAAIIASALAPTNALLGNPAAVKAAFETGGRSVAQGALNALRDIRHNKGMPAQVDRSAFELGKNVAVSPGAVVFRNQVLELIQYAPTTAQVRARPQLIVPPQINKFYAFDLSPGRSIVEHLVANGFQVFVASWRNPTPKHRDWDMDTYVAALVEAIDAIGEITSSKDVCVHGACSGAMTTAALLGYLAQANERRVHAATLMVAVLGATRESALGLFATPRTIAAAKRVSAKRGVLRGEDMGRVFAWLRPDDLVWNYWVNNYLLGRAPPAFDVLFWNSDTTRLPARFHAQLLDMFAQDLLRSAGKLKVLGKPIDLAKVRCDKYVVAGATDHITPWKGVHAAARTFGGRTRFVLSSSGHIQSLVNPPGNPKASFCVNPRLVADPQRWLAGAKSTQGSWWVDWVDWLGERSGPWRDAPAALGSARHPADAAAPGRYVSEP